MVLIENTSDVHKTIRIDGHHETLSPGEQRDLECDPSNIDFLERVEEDATPSESGRSSNADDQALSDNSEVNSAQNARERLREVTNEMTKDEIKQVIDDRDLDVKKSQRKDALIEDVNAALSEEV